MTAVFEGPMCGSWEDALERNRGVVELLPARMREDVLCLIADQEKDRAREWAANSPTPEEVDEATLDLDCMVPAPLEECEENTR
jgi:hypothetical protein